MKNNPIAYRLRLARPRGLSWWLVTTAALLALLRAAGAAPNDLATLLALWHTLGISVASADCVARLWIRNHADFQLTPVEALLPGLLQTAANVVPLLLLLGWFQPGCLWGIPASPLIFLFWLTSRIGRFPWRATVLAVLVYLCDCPEWSALFPAAVLVYEALLSWRGFRPREESCSTSRPTFNSWVRPWSQHPVVVRRSQMEARTSGTGLLSLYSRRFGTVFLVFACLLLSTVWPNFCCATCERSGMLALVFLIPFQA